MNSLSDGPQAEAITVVLVEDDAPTLWRLQDALAKAGYQVKAAGTLAEARARLAAGPLAHAQSGLSPQEQMACRSDAGKFCSKHIGKPPQMNACLKANKEKLSDGCRKVVESRGG